MKERDHSIDIAKGLLILGVVWFHMKTILIGSCGLEHSMFYSLYSAYKGYAIFFMPAFFFITGYCSNYNKHIKDFFLANVKGILIPMVILNAIPCLLTFSIEGLKYLLSWNNWIYGLSFWFLPVLFLAKMMYWPILHYAQSWWLTQTILLLCFLCAIFCDSLDWLANYWYWKSALAYVFFIGFGYFFKTELSALERINWLKIGTCIYIMVLCIVLYFNLPVWYLGLSLTCSFSQMPFFLIAAISGTLAILFLAHLIHKNIVLGYIGRASLVIYCSHWFIGQHLGKYLANFFPPDTDIKAILFYVFVVAVTIFFSCVFDFFYKKALVKVGLI